MGYYTRYELGISRTSSIAEYESIWQLIETDNGEYDYIRYAVIDGEQCKWYEHEKDMKQFSLKFPHVLFTLHGEGEEAGDLWIDYYKNGKVQHCVAKITYENFDESKLI